MRPASCRHTPAPGRDSRGADRAEDEGDSEHDERDRPEEVEVEVGQELADEEEGAHDEEDGAEDDGPVAAAAASGGASRSALGTTLGPPVGGNRSGGSLGRLGACSGRVAGRRGRGGRQTVGEPTLTLSVSSLRSLAVAQSSDSHASPLRLKPPWKLVEASVSLDVTRSPTPNGMQTLRLAALTEALPRVALAGSVRSVSAAFTEREKCPTRASDRSMLPSEAREVGRAHA